MRQTLLNEMEVKGDTKSLLAQKVDMSNSQITAFFQGKEISFDKAVQIVREVKSDSESELINQYCLEVKSPKNIRYAMEYASTHRLLDELSHLINKATNHQNKTLQDYAHMYKLVHDWQTDNYESETELYTKLQSFCPSDLTIKLLQSLLSIKVI